MNRSICLTLALLFLTTPVFATPEEQAVLQHYADMAHAKYEDSLIAARSLQEDVDEVAAAPTDPRLVQAADDGRRLTDSVRSRARE